MPDTIVNYSKVSLPGTNIMERANLANHGFETWKVLNKRTRNIFNVFANPTTNAIKSYFIPMTPPGSPTNSPPDSPTNSYVLFDHREPLLELLKYKLKLLVSDLDKTEY